MRKRDAKLWQASWAGLGCSLLLACAPVQPDETGRRELPAGERLYRSQPTVTPQYAVPGRFDVGVTTLEVVNPSVRSAQDFATPVDRPLTLEVWYPGRPGERAAPAVYRDVLRSHQPFAVQGMAVRDVPVVEDAGAFPVVVLSHGYTGYRTIMFYLGEHLASHGYVVVAIDHTDSTNADVDMATAPFAGFMSTLLNRARDQQFVLETVAQMDSTLGRVVDDGRAAIVGYSMGGYGALNTVGGCYAYSEAMVQAFGVPAAVAGAVLPVLNSCSAGREAADPRWKAMIALSPWGGEQGVHSEASLQKLTVPSLFVAGDEDDISGFENGIARLHAQVGSEHNYLMVYENARHNVAAHPAPAPAYTNDLDIGHYFEPSWNTETINRINQHMSLLFLDCHVKGMAERCESLPVRDDITQTKGADGKLSEPWPGFSDRWGTGVRFFRR